MAQPDTKPTLSAHRLLLGAPRERAFLDQLSGWVSDEVDAKCDPTRLRFRALRRMDTDPIVYLGERAITALIRKPDLYHVVSPTGNKKLVSETEEWLWKLMNRHLLAIIARSFVYGAIPYVLDLERGDLVIRDPVAGKEGETRKRTRKDFWRYTVAREFYPDGVELALDPRGDLTGLTVLATGQRFDTGRGRVVVWDQQFGEWAGQSARRRAWPAFAKGRIFELLQARYLERSVHTPLLITAPGENVIGATSEEDMSAGEYVAAQLSALMGGGYMTMPNDLMEGSQEKRKYEVTPLELPERSEVFDRALDRFDSQKLAAYLVPPAMSMIEDSIGGGAARVLTDMFATFIEGLVSGAAHELTQVVAAVHAFNDSDEPPCEVQANEIPSKVQKLYLDVLGKVGDAARLGERVNVDQLLDYLGVPRTPGPLPEKAPEGAGPGTPGRKRDPLGERENRREDARTEEGEEDTGGKRDENGNPEKKT